MGAAVLCAHSHGKAALSFTCRLIREKMICNSSAPSLTMLQGINLTATVKRGCSIEVSKLVGISLLDLLKCTPPATPTTYQHCLENKTIPEHLSHEKK